MYPLVAQTTGGRWWWVLGWEEPLTATGHLVPVVIPHSTYGLDATPRNIVGPDGDRTVTYDVVPAAPVRLPLEDITGYYGPGDAHG
jgi:hypothetical protein